MGEIGARDRARRLSVHAGQYFVRGRGPDVLLEGPLNAPAGATLALDEKKLDRIAYDAGASHHHATSTVHTSVNRCET